MMKLGIFFMISLITMLGMVGCEKDTSSAVDDNTLSEMELQESVLDEENDYLLDWGIDDGSEGNIYDGYSSFPKVMDPIDEVLRFGRIINHRFRRQFTITRLNPDSVLVSVTRQLNGKFVIFGIDNLQDTSIYRKDLTHIAKRKAIFVKRHPQYQDNPGRGRWRLQSVTLGEGMSQPTNTIQIHEVVVYNSSGDSIVFTDPLETFLTVPDDIPTFNTGETVTIRVNLENMTPYPFIGPDGATETVLLHFGRNRFRHSRKRFTYVGTSPVTGYSIYEGFWQIGQQPYRIRHAIVDAIDNGSIYDDDEIAYPYNSTTWGAPYRVID
jgi:hypothetical protein